MFNQRHIEELRDMLPSLKHDAEFLYRYGDVTSSSGLFHNLSLNDRKRLLYLALTQGDKDVQNVARFLMQRLKPTPQSIPALLAGLSQEERAELAEIREALVSTPRSSLEEDRQRIAEELRRICHYIGHSKVEEAYWILIPDSQAVEPIWIEAVGGPGDPYSGVRISFQVTYHVMGEQRYDLIARMREASWILHIHNHPLSTSPGYIIPCLPSGADLNFAEGWKSERPELEKKMKFFVIQENRAVEYALPHGRTERWL